jgi:hypothetical protein
MIQLLSVITLSLTILSASTVLTNTPKQYSFIARVSNVTIQNNIYYTTVIDENGEEWMLEADQDLTNQWLDVQSSDMGTKYLYDDEITNFNILED